MPPLPTGMEKKEFMTELKKRIEDKCAELNRESAEKYPHAKQLLQQAQKD